MLGIFEQVFNVLRIVAFVTISSPVGTEGISEAQAWEVLIRNSSREVPPSSVRGHIHI